MLKSMNLADSVRRHCAQVCGDLKFIKINHDRLADYAITTTPPEPTKPALQESKSLRSPTAIERQRLLVLSLDAINFGSGWHDVVAKKEGLSGARSMAAALYEFEANNGPLTPATLQSLDQTRCAEIFGQDHQNSDAMELMGHFSEALNQIGAHIEAHGSASNLIEGCASSAVRLAESLAQVSSFADVGFYKRAQIAAADLARNGLADFDDLPKLTAFADNLVPHVLAVDGIIDIDSDLARHIARGDLLKPGSRPETELRAAAVHVVELMCRQTPQLRAMDIDQSLWERGGGVRYKQRRRPRCRSLYY